jgi:hypothetical protein
MPTPSLLIVPSRWKAGSPGKLYSQIPTNGNGDFNVTRATTATRVNASGLIEVVASGIPRLDYPIGGGCPALLVEPSGTNFARGVERLNTPTPTTAAGGITVTTGSTDFLAPDGTSGTITKYVGGTASGSNFLEYVSSTSVTAAGVHTFSAFVKAGATNPLNFCALQFTAFTGGSGTGTSYFSLASGTALTTGASIQNYGNGWYRIISAPYTIAAGDLTGDIRLLFAEGNNDASFPASGALNLTLYAWGIQLEAGSIATSYIPTTTGSITRNADVVSVSGAVSGSIGQTQGTIYLDLTVLGKGSSSATRWVQIFGPSNNIGLAINSSNLFRSIVNTQSDTLLTAPLISSGVKVAWAYDATGTTCFINGTQYTLTTGGNQTMSSLTSISIDGSANTAFGFARIRAAALYTTRLSDADLMLLTMPGNNTYLPQAVWDNYLSRTGNSEVPDCLYTRHADLLDV